MLNNNQLHDAIGVLQPIVVQCGDAIEQYHGIASFTHKTNNYDILTEYDTRIEKELKSGLQKVYPDIPFVGEELGGDYSAEEFWLVDPIDGTIHFARGLPFSMVMVSLVQNNTPVLGVLYNFVTKEFFSAYTGGGAYLNGEPIRVSPRDVSEAVLLSEINLSINDNAEMFAAMNKRFKFLDTCSAGYEFGLVASGAVEGRVTKDPYGKAYDFAAGAVIVSEAGGIVREISGAAFTIDSRDFIVASSEGLFKEIVSLIPIREKEIYEGKV